MLRKVFKWVVVAFICLVSIYAVWVIVAMNRVATISVDYVALLNESAAAIPDDQRAWPLYREAAISLKNFPEPDTVFIDEDIDKPTLPDQEGWNHYRDWIDSHAKTIETIHIGASKHGVGLILDGTISEDDKNLWPDEYESQQNAEQQNGFLASILVPHLGHYREMARLLSIDAKDSAASGYASRCIKDIGSMIAIGIHTREHPILINDLVSFSIFNHTFSTLNEILDQYSYLFSSDQLEELSKELQQLNGNMSIRFEGERMFLLDLLQRMYTDDGNGDGKIVPIEAAKTLSYIEPISPELTSFSLVPAIFAPVADVFLASRKELLEEYDRRISYFKSKSVSSSNNSGYVGEPLSPSTSTINPFFLMELLTPAYEKAIKHANETRENRDDILKRVILFQQAK
ncbi:MAG: hypothetical protein QF718_09310 [Phycisphaerales bacterium]|jgi:hypothetical protein|nr:hypothetical protein [Phycisphaerales bacterium]